MPKASRLPGYMCYSENFRKGGVKGNARSLDFFQMMWLHVGIHTLHMRDPLEAFKGELQYHLKAKPRGGSKPQARFP